MNNRKSIVFVAALGVILLSIFSIIGNKLNAAKDIDGNALSKAYNINGNAVFPDIIPIPVPSGNLSASEIILLPDLYQTGKGFTCTGLSYNSKTDTFLIGDIGAMQPGDSYHSRIVRMSSDFLSVEGTIQIHEKITTFGIIQGLTVDTKRDTIWVCSTTENLIRQIDYQGNPISSFQISNDSPTGIAYSFSDDSLWVLTYGNKIVHYSINGGIIESYNFSYEETLDQCFLDEYRGLLYITAGTNYQGRNNVYCFDIVTHAQFIACTVDSYSVEGIWLGDSNKMVILNDGYYHSAAVDKNQVNIYTIN